MEPWTANDRTDTELNPISTNNVSEAHIMSKSLPTMLTRNVIEPKCYGHGLGYWGSMRPMIDADSRFRRKRTASQWVWDNPGAAESCLDAVWSMTGKWRARRGARTPISRKLFDKVVTRQVRELADVLNAFDVNSLHAFKDLDPADIRKVVGHVLTAVIKVSKVKKNKVLNPMFGSKVLHHYFPGIVPIYDTAYLRNKALRKALFTQFASEGGDGGWLKLLPRRRRDLGNNVKSFELYLMWCAAQLAEAPDTRIAAARRTFVRASGISTTGIAKSSPLWHLDARIAEICLREC